MSSIGPDARFDALLTLFIQDAEDAAQRTGCVQRLRCFCGATLVRTLVFGFLHHPRATLTNLVTMAAVVGVTISPQGLAKRFTPALTETLTAVLAAAVLRLVLASDPAPIPLLARFSGVWIHDSTTITLPATLAEQWPSCGGSPCYRAAALKAQVGLDLLRGRLAGPLLQSGRAQDRSSPLRQTPVDPGSLQLSDTGYFSLPILAAIRAQDAYSLTRLPVQVAVYVGHERLDLARACGARRTRRWEQAVTIGVEAQVPMRLVVERVPAAVAAQRRARAKADARRKGQQVSKTRLRLARWTLLVTDVPLRLLSVDEALELGQARWQIELLFKLWKQHALVDESRSTQPWRVLAEVLAKLLGVVVQHWLILAGGGWQIAERSLTKMAAAVRDHAVSFAYAFGQVQRMAEVLDGLSHCLERCRMNRRATAPNTCDRLLGHAPRP
jgi:DDE family transposase